MPILSIHNTLEPLKHTCWTVGQVRFEWPCVDCKQHTAPPTANTEQCWGFKRESPKNKLVKLGEIQKCDEIHKWGGNIYFMMLFDPKTHPNAPCL